VVLIVLTYFVIFPRIVVPDQNISLDIIYVSSVLPTVEITYLALGGVSIVFLALQFFALIVGRRAWKKSPAGSRDKARRAVWTARLSLALPNTLFLVVTLMLWGALARTATSLLPDCPLYELAWPFGQYFYVSVDPQFTLPACDNSGKPLASITAERFLQELITLFATPVFALAMILSLGAGLLAVWGLLPMAWAEVKSPQEPQDQSSEQYQKWLETGKHQGEWLTSGFRFLKGAGWLVILAMAIFILIGAVWAGIKLFWAEHAEYTESAIYGAAFAKCVEWTSSSLSGAVITCTDVLKSMSGLSSDFIGGFATIIVGSAVGLFALRGRVEKFALGFRSLVDVALDVDNHLREHPSDAAPRARIAARYVSLLRYISNWKHASGEGYKAIIIVAHSQGTVITADLLRFLIQQEDDTRDEELKAFFSQFVGKSLYFFTVGCPLRQLYSLRFPHLYGWAYHLREEDWGEYDSLKHRIDEGQEPDHTALGVTNWVNAFRSGDYVGRWLWRPDACKYQFSPGERAEPKRYVSVDATGARREFCLGAGAHTHYFDETACAIGLEIDELIRKAAESKNSA
jgi:hypothetical protein